MLVEEKWVLILLKEKKRAARGDNHCGRDGGWVKWGRSHLVCVGEGMFLLFRDCDSCGVFEFWIMFDNLGIMVFPYDWPKHGEYGFPEYDFC